MSQKLLNNLRELAESIEKNTPEIQEKLKQSSGATPDSSVVVSASKYHSALERLAEE